MKNSMFKRVTIGTALGGALLLSAGMGVANAEARDGQVDVLVGTAGVLNNVPIGAASQVAASLCDRERPQVTPVAEQVDVDGAQQNICSNILGAIDLRQNDGSTAQVAAEAPEGTEAAETPAAALDAAEAPEGTGAAETPAAPLGAAEAPEGTGTALGAAEAHEGTAPGTPAAPITPAPVPAAG